VAGSGSVQCICIWPCASSRRLGVSGCGVRMLEVEVAYCNVNANISEYEHAGHAPSWNLKVQ
jgi:hypothetical protein